ncbi:MAG: YHYH protein [Kordia sp.]|nr:MAG: YHYH protein [Kordia sp.]
MKNMFKMSAVLLVIICGVLACSSDESSILSSSNEGGDTGVIVNGGDADISVLSSYFSTANTTFVIYDDNIVITTTSEPDHKSAYYPTNHALYEAYMDASFVQNPNAIVEQDITMTIPRYPVVASTHTATDLGSIGIAVNSVSIYNQYAGPNNQALTNEIASFDQGSGHPQAQGGYHYHLESVWLTQQNGNEGLVGILLDGFPVYGTHENGVLMTNADLDVYHGHTSATADFPNGIYHYHVTAEAPYINGDGYYGAAGILTN